MSHSTSKEQRFMSILLFFFILFENKYAAHIQFTMILIYHLKFIEITETMGL